jgi:cystathionine beta-lyase family protein involved in aluminum resistance
MASGNFISGSSIELSADAPIRKPFAVWIQGGTNFYMSKIAILNAACKLPFPGKQNKNLFSEQKVLCL